MLKAVEKAPAGWREAAEPTAVYTPVATATNVHGSAATTVKEMDVACTPVATATAQQGLAATAVKATAVACNPVVAATAL